LKERRQYKRIAVRKKVRLKLPDIEDKPCGKSFCYSLCEDISQGGIKIPSEYFLPVKQTINMEVFLENSFGIICTRGEVRWIASTNADFKYEVGIEFVDISTGSKNCLNKFCQLQN
jgi:c-di-GMP-binding flagellar brake protein YcgR